MTSDKAYSAESRLNALWNHLGPVAAGGGNGQRRTYVNTATQSITSTTRVPVTSLTAIPVTPGASYTFQGILAGQQGATAAGQVIGFDGPVISGAGRVWTESNATANTSVTDGDFSGALPWLHTTPAWGAGVTFYFRFTGYFTVSSGTTFGMVAGEGTNLDTWTILAASLLTIESVGQTT